ncbi:MAG: hypothetical protein WKF28_04490 [Rubrobacteraceae bacterium]
MQDSFAISEDPTKFAPAIGGQEETVASGMVVRETALAETSATGTEEVLGWRTRS